MLEAPPARRPSVTGAENGAALRADVRGAGAQRWRTGHKAVWKTAGRLEASRMDNRCLDVVKPVGSVLKAGSAEICVHHRIHSSVLDSVEVVGEALHGAREGGSFPQIQVRLFLRKHIQKHCRAFRQAEA